MHHRAVSLLVLALGLSEPAVFAAWSDRTAGLPAVEIVSGKTMGIDGNNQAIAQDKLGRIFVGSSRLHVFDGQSWQSFAKPNRDPLTSLAIGEDGKLWAGGNNELGYFQEETLGAFQFHSLVPNLPEEARDIGLVWGCAPVGNVVYFVCQNKLLRWDGKVFQITTFDTDFRLFAMTVNDESWFFHRETGLYRLTEKGPTLEVPASELKHITIMGLFRDETGLITVSNHGFIRPGNPTTVISSKDLNDYLERHIVSAFDELPDGNLAIGTLSGGMVLASRTGKLIQSFDSGNGLPGRSVYNLAHAAPGEIIGVTPTDLFHFFAAGEITLFNARNGLTGDVVNFLKQIGSSLYAVTEDGVFVQTASDNYKAAFDAMPALSGVFWHVQPYNNGLLLCRFGEVDFFDGIKIYPIDQKFIGETYLVLPTRNDPRILYVCERYGLSRLIEESDGRLHRSLLVRLPDNCTTLYEDSAGRLWIGTDTKGAFIYDPATSILSPFKNPSTDEPLPGSVKIVGNDHRITLFFAGGILNVDASGKSMGTVKSLPELAPLEVGYTTNGNDILVTYQHPGGGNQLSYGAGVLSFTDQGETSWRELDIPSLGAIGPVRSMTFTEENDRPILWLGGTEGILRVDYDKIKTLEPPPAPIIRSNDSLASHPAGYPIDTFPFKNHQVQLMTFTSDYVRGKDWLIQTRLDGGEWSAPSPRRSFEFTNLSEGKYRFEARAVNSANMASPSAALSFTILPPWYRTGKAYGGYAAGLALVVFGFIRVRDRRIRNYNRELETLVAKRTEELVRANAAKDEFLASVSHEIRNPMNGVIGIAESFKTDVLDPDNRRKFDLLKQCASHLSSLLESLLDYSRVQAGAFDLNPKPFDLPALLESIAALTTAESEQRGIPIEVAISPSVPRQLTGDSQRIGQILLNFIRNALNFSHQGQISVTVWCKAAGPGLVEVFFAVSDEGPGISPEEQKKLFTRFERGAAAQHCRIPGTGLGLALCRTLAGKMGGRIWLESELGVGSCFYFCAPFASDGQPVLPAPAARPPAEWRAQAALVVDDEDYNRIALGDLLESLGFSVQAAAEGPEALTLAGHRDFDFIFLDFAMPGMNGLEVSRGIRALPNRSALARIFAVTAFSTPDKRAQCLAAGMNGFLGKPITMERLRQALAAASPNNLPGPSSSKDTSNPADPLARLRLLATKKSVSLGDELALYFSELAAELERLMGALELENINGAQHYAHLLCGRCGFIHERELELLLMKTGHLTTAGHWEEARSLGRDIQARIAALQIRLAADAPVAPRA